MQTNRRALVGLGLLAASAGLAGSARAAPTVDVRGDPKSAYRGAVDDIAAFAGRHVEVHGLPGLTLALTARDGFTAILQFGHADLERGVAVGPDHLFQIGSISKSFTAICIFQLVEAGKLSLDADVRSLLPGVPLPPDGPTTVRSLLNHSSGLPDDAPIFPRGGNQTLWRGFAPGKRWSYSNLGFMLLSAIVEEIERRPFAAVLKARVLSPLGMISTRGAILTGDRRLYANGYAPFYTDRGYPRAGPLGPAAWVDMTEGSGCVASTAGDMALYAHWLAEAGQGRAWRAALVGRVGGEVLQGHHPRARLGGEGRQVRQRPGRGPRGRPRPAAPHRRHAGLQLGDPCGSAGRRRRLHQQQCRPGSLSAAGDHRLCLRTAAGRD